MEQLIVPQGAFSLHRYPVRAKETLRAWDAADELLLQHVNELDNQGTLSSSPSVLIVNDQFGALSIALSEWSPHMSSDSWISHCAIQANLRANGKALDEVELLSSVEALSGEYDLVLIKVPKSLAMLEDQLARLRPHLTEHSIVVGAGMVKAIHTSTLKLFEKLVGETKTSLAKKKARLILSTPDLSLSPVLDKYPSQYQLENTSYQIFNHAGVFSRDSLDIGTRFFLQHLPDVYSSDGYKVVDLGCGNGVVGMMMAHKNETADITFVDESFMAVDSARLNFQAAFANDRKVDYKVTDCLSDVDSNSADMVLNNPPFHQQNVVGDFIALQMFRDAKRVLKKGGELWVIGNRHLGYHMRLKKLFGNCELMASNKKFVILKAHKL